REISPFVVEDGALIEVAVAVLVLEDHDAVRSLVGRGPVRIGQAFDHPEPAAIVEGESDGLDDIGLTGEEGGAKPIGQRHPARCFPWWDGPVRPAGRWGGKEDREGEEGKHVRRHGFSIPMGGANRPRSRLVYPARIARLKCGTTPKDETGYI